MRCSHTTTLTQPSTLTAFSSALATCTRSRDSIAATVRTALTAIDDDAGPRAAAALVDAASDPSVPPPRRVDLLYVFDALLASLDARGGLESLPAPAARALAAAAPRLVAAAAGRDSVSRAKASKVAPCGGRGAGSPPSKYWTGATLNWRPRWRQPPLLSSRRQTLRARPRRNVLPPPPPRPSSSAAPPPCVLPRMRPPRRASRSRTTARMGAVMTTTSGGTQTRRRHHHRRLPPPWPTTMRTL